jgi:hypothetical protein
MIVPLKMLIVLRKVVPLDIIVPDLQGNPLGLADRLNSSTGNNDDNLVHWEPPWGIDLSISRYTTNPPRSFVQPLNDQIGYGSIQIAAFFDRLDPLGEDRHGQSQICLDLPLFPKKPQYLILAPLDGSIPFHRFSLHYNGFFDFFPSWKIRNFPRNNAFFFTSLIFPFGEDKYENWSFYLGCCIFIGK